jgi:hypothetical protein
MAAAISSDLAEHGRNPFPRLGRRAFSDDGVEQHVPATAADFLVTPQQALSLIPSSLGGLD